MIFIEREGERISAVLLDVELPYVHGSLVFARLRALQPHVPVIGMSGLSEEQVMCYFAENELAGFMKKPFSKNELLDSVRSVLSEFNSEDLLAQA